MTCYLKTFGSLRAMLLLAAALFVVPGLTNAQTGDKADQKAGAEQAVRQTLDELYSALGRNDVATLDRIYSDDYTLVNEEGEVTAKAPRLAAIKSGKMKYGSIGYSDASIRIHGNMAVAIFRVMLKATSNGKEISGPVRVTATLLRSKGAWQLAAAQATRISQ